MNEISKFGSHVSKTQGPVFIGPFHTCKYQLNVECVTALLCVYSQ